MPGVLITVDALYGKTDPKTWLGGDAPGGMAYNRPLVVNAKYKNTAPTNDNAHDCMMAVDRALHDHLGTIANPTDVMAWSMGAQAGVSKWLREMAPTSDIVPGTVRFFATGNPENDYGVCVKYPLNSFPKYPGDPAHGGTPHTPSCPTPLAFHGGLGVGFGYPAVVNHIVYDIKMQFDGWADAPAVLTNSELTRIVDFEPVFSHSPFCVLKNTGNNGPHGIYFLPFDGPDAFAFPDPSPQRPHFTHVWIRNYPVPSANSMRKVRFIARLLDSQRRATMDSAYTWRPLTIAPPDYSLLPSWFKFTP